MLAELRVDALFLCSISDESMFAFKYVYFKCRNSLLWAKRSRWLRTG